jgi:hypothetical protein
MAGKMFLEIVPQMKEVVLMHNLSIHDSWRSSRKIRPPDISIKEFDLIKKLRSPE